MHVISRKALREFSEIHADAEVSLNAWYRAANKGTFNHLAELKQTFKSVDYVKLGKTGFYVFDIGGNKYRLIAAIHFDKQRLFIRHVLTHAEYDKKGLEKMKPQKSSAMLTDPAKYAPLLAIRNAREYNAAVDQLNQLVDEIGDNSKDPRYRFIDTLSVLIEAYDEEHNQIPDATPVELLKFLMEQHGLSQGDLPEIGSQGVVSEIFRGKRELNVRQIQALSRRFHLPVGAFFPEPERKHSRSENSPRVLAIGKWRLC